ncbi:hypothetical protein ASC95_27150 [Pelomonas sp. Root1217]|uniref:hypothetical protein n=1 Tax=Pelomonas sp. Root1217 TaxID=1736430 RepID=UPI00070FB889|nr:hypothetical protein [Pelomonas sp. Root1217]KQV46281.1 hypothetical protein ASC95_27150 [Pelomonas sp. Root1217]
MLDRRPKVKRLLLGLCVLLVAWYAALFVYGFANFPMAPYKPCGTQEYCDKSGQPRAKADFEAFEQWERLFLLSVPLGIAAAFVVRKLWK